MIARILYLATMLWCLYVPALGDEPSIYRGILLSYAGIPLAIAAATLATVHPGRVITGHWSNLLAGAWAAGAALVCTSSLPFSDLAIHMVVQGGALALAAVAVLVAAAQGVVLNRNLSVAGRALFGVGMLVYGIVFLTSGVLVLRAPYGGTVGGSFAAAEAFRATVLGAAGLTAIATVLESARAARRSTSGGSSTAVP